MPRNAGIFSVPRMMKHFAKETAKRLRMGNPMAFLSWSKMAQMLSQPGVYKKSTKYFRKIILKEM